MYQANEALGERDNWAGISNPVTRRRIQNRLNQRAQRRRKEPHKWTPLRSRIEDIHLGHQSLSTLAHERGGSRTADTAIELAFPLTPDHLIQLIHYNVFRAMFSNMFMLGISPEIACHTAGLSVNIRTTSLPDPSRCPPSLMPTLLQQTTPHPVWMDLFPLSALRDAVILTGCSIDRVEFARDMVGLAEERTERAVTTSVFDWERHSIVDDAMRNGIIVWGEPSEVASWEITEGFLEKWGWLVGDGWEELLRATDRWRLARQEDLIVWENWGISMS